MKQKYFIAIIPPEPIFSEIETIKKEVSLLYSNKSALRSPAHITLHMPFEWKENKENDLINSLNGFTFNNAISVELKNYSCFEPKVVFIDVVANETLASLQTLLVQHIKKNCNIFNQANDARGFHPHITIAFRDLKKSAFYEMMNVYKEKKFSASFTSHSYFLLKLIDKKWQAIKEFSFIA